MLAGLQEVSSWGGARGKHHDRSSLNAIAGWFFREFGTLSHLNVLENIMFPLKKLDLQNLRDSSALKPLKWST